MISQFNNSDTNLKSIRTMKKKRKKVNILKHVNRYVNSPNRDKEKLVEEQQLLNQLPTKDK
jgi:hypothetical protein